MARNSQGSRKKQQLSSVQIHFSDFFRVSPDRLEEYGAFNISLINDLPLFIDPFLLFHSENEEYRKLHEEIIRYLQFLRDKSTENGIHEGLLKSWFTFREEKQNWFGYSLVGNSGSGLGIKFARSLNENLNTIFSNFGNEQITQSSHLEKLCLIESGVGKDSISDLTTNLIKPFLLHYTEEFAKLYIADGLKKRVIVDKVFFDYNTEFWMPQAFTLPFHNGDYVLLTPRDILTKEDVWINRPGMLHDFRQVATGIPNDQLRAQVNNYFLTLLSRPGKPLSNREIAEAKISTIRQFPEFIEHYIRHKEDRGDEAVVQSDLRVADTENFFVVQLSDLVEFIHSQTPFYEIHGTTYKEAHARLEYLKDAIENKGCHRFFYQESGKPITRESDLHIMYRLVWFGTPSDVSQEVNDGRGPADYKISRGAHDKTIVEFKLAKNTQLKRNLQNQTPIYQKASNAKHGVKVIFYFSAKEHRRVLQILKDLDLIEHPDVILIDARDDNKPSASKA